MFLVASVCSCDHFPWCIGLHHTGTPCTLSHTHTDIGLHCAGTPSLAPNPLTLVPTPRTWDLTIQGPLVLGPLPIDYIGTLTTPCPIDPTHGHVQTWTWLYRDPHHFQPLPAVFKLVHYEVRTGGKRAVGIDWNTFLF